MTVVKPGEVVSVFLVDDHDIVREGLTAILGRDHDIDIVGEAATAEDALPALVELNPAVVVLDQRLPGMSGVDLCREIAERKLRTQVVILSAFVEDGIVEAAFRAGARAYVVKDVEASQLKRAIRAAARAETTIDPKVAGQFVAWASRVAPNQASPLSPAQLRVLRLLADGKTAREIASSVRISHHTVKGHMREIYRRLGVSSRAEAAAVGLRQGWI
ncbi:MAG TPA: response regulator transcription factor [Actinomycetota bacterium]